MNCTYLGIYIYTSTQ